MSTARARPGALRIGCLLVAAVVAAGCGVSGPPSAEVPTVAATRPAAASQAPSASLASPAATAASPPSPSPAVASPATASPAIPSPAATVASASAAPTAGRPSASTGLHPGDPDPALTPGATNPGVTQANIGSTVCVSGYTAKIRPPATYTDALKRQQIAQYGYVDTTPSAYEEDHLVSLELGGNPRDPRNLWPEPYQVTLADGTNVGARTKDRFEDWLHREVCSGAVSLADAQREIATDWVGAWLAAGTP